MTCNADAEDYSAFFLALSRLFFTAYNDKEKQKDYVSRLTCTCNIYLCIYLCGALLPE